jgi:hypothetical protein
VLTDSSERSLHVYRAAVESIAWNSVGLWYAAMQGMERELNKGKVDISGNTCWGYKFLACRVEGTEVEN